MIEIQGNIWEVDCDYICIPTNGFVKNNGRAVMGAGLAKQARDKFQNIDLELGRLINTTGNCVHALKVEHNKILLSFPVKHDWWDKADLVLIDKSADELKFMFNVVKEPKPIIALPRVGCGNGKLLWSVVKPILEKYFVEDNFVIVDYIK